MSGEMRQVREQLLGLAECAEEMPADLAARALPALLRRLAEQIIPDSAGYASEVAELAAHTLTQHQAARIGPGIWQLGPEWD